MITKFAWLLIGSISINTILISSSLFSQEVESGKKAASTPSGKHEGGYLLMAPLGSNDVHLLDRDGESIHHWNGKHRPGHSVYLLDDGSLLRTGSLGRRGSFGFQGGGLGGVVEKVSWSGEVTWSLDWASEKHISHHDIEPLPNGNFLMIAWEKKNKEECLAVGRHPALLPQDELWVDAILEIHPTGKSGGEVIWRWSPWDHLIQDIDPEKPDHGSASDHPEKIDINYVSFQSRELGQPDWMHTNSVDYNPHLDQIILSVHGFDEVWIIDHSTSGAENPGLLWRWGNPQTHGRGSDSDRELFKQHDAHWISAGLPGEGHIMIFNNGQGRRGNYSTVLELATPITDGGQYLRDKENYFSAPEPIWKYEDPGNFFSSNISGAERLPGGNTLICSGANGQIFEVTSNGTVVWEHINEGGFGERGAGIRGGGARGGAVFRVPWISPDHPGLRPVEPVRKKPARGTAL